MGDTVIQSSAIIIQYFRGCASLILYIVDNYASVVKTCIQTMKFDNCVVYLALYSIALSLLCQQRFVCLVCLSPCLRVIYMSQCLSVPPRLCACLGLCLPVRRFFYLIFLHVLRYTCACIAYTKVSFPLTLQNRSDIPMHGRDTDYIIAWFLFMSDCSEVTVLFLCLPLTVWTVSRS